ncbi:hypothetical protein HDU93_001379, partial [Gonapodya sp. JEL0774]
PSDDQQKANVVTQAAEYCLKGSEIESGPSTNIGFTCGNAVRVANLRAGETVLDLGSGGGLDVFLASKGVSENGKVIGVDANP